MFDSKVLKNKNQIERRRFLKLASLALASPLISPDLRYAAHELLIGKAYAQDMNGMPPMNFIEINLRDQWDFGHAFVPPGIATHQGDLGVGHDGRRIPLFHNRNDLIQEANNYWLTSDVLELRPHLDTIATCESYELTDGAIHGHEAANALRSPGRSKSNKGSNTQMWLDENTGEQGNEHHYSTTPTPLALHNHWVHSVEPGVRNAVAFKLMSRFHTCYHHSAGLSNAQPDRFQTKASLLDAYRNLSLADAEQIMPTKREAEELIANLRRLDRRFVEKYGYNEAGQRSHLEVLNGSSKLIYDDAVLNGGEGLPLTEEEIAYWSADVPDQQAGNSRAQIWEQAAYATKLISKGVQRSVALEFDYVDVHDRRDEFQMVTMAKQFANPLARMIEQLKAQGIYDNTVIAVYSLDGGRSPHAYSSGDQGLNTMVLAGGGIRGGYFGDTRLSPISNGINNDIYYHRPDSQGNPVTDSAVNNQRDKRTPGRDGWRTLMKALNIPDSLASSFPDTQNGQVQQYMLRG